MNETRPPNAALALGEGWIGRRVSDLPPVSGRLRLVFYTGLLLLAFRDEKSPIRGYADYSRVDPELFRVYGLMDWLGVPYLSPSTVLVIIAALILCWIAAAIGLFTRLSMIATALLFVFLHGLFLGSNAFNHNWFVPMYAVVAMAFASPSREWSVDGWLYCGDGHVAETSAGAGRSGLARWAFLVLVVGFYFAAGVGKLQTSGFAWADGHTIGYFAGERGDLTLFGDLVASQPMLSQMAAILALSFELGAVLALLSPTYRYVMLAGWTAMHLGINLVMGPDYWENVWCFILLVNWGTAGATLREVVDVERLGVSPDWFRSSTPVTNAPSRWTVGLTSCLFPLVATVAFVPLFWWPLTNTYMYCSYFSREYGIRGDHALAVYRDPHQVQHLARSYLREPPPIEAMEYFAYRAALRVSRNDGSVEHIHAPPGTADRKQFLLTVARPVLVRDLASKPDGRLEFDPRSQRLPAQRFLEDYVQVFRRHTAVDEWLEGDRLELTYLLDERDGTEVVLGTVPIS